MARNRIRAGDEAWPPEGWPHADEMMSAFATGIMGRVCYVCPGYDAATGELLFMVADGINKPVLVNKLHELPGAVAELDAGLGMGCG